MVRVEPELVRQIGFLSGNITIAMALIPAFWLLSQFRDNKQLYIWIASRDSFRNQNQRTEKVFPVYLLPLIYLHNGKRDTC